MLSELPDPIKEHILKSINNESYTPMPNAFGVTEILGCIRQTFFRKLEERRTGKSKPFDLNSSYAFYRGKLFDSAWTNLFDRNQIRCTHRVSGYPITISGHFDFMWNDEVWDLKTTKNLYFVKEPSKQYCKQVRFYAYCNSLNGGKLLYIDMGDCKVFNVPMDNIEETIREIENKAIELYKALNTVKCEYCGFLLNKWDINNGGTCPSCNKFTYGILKAPPKPVFDKDETWHCKSQYCSYYNECQNNDYGVQQKLVL